MSETAELSGVCQACGNDAATLCLDCVQAPDEEPERDLRETAEEGIRALLALVGETPGRPGLYDTPKRFVNAYVEMCNRPGDPGVDLSVVFPDIRHGESPVMVGPIPFVSVCEHHLLPFTGSAWVSYVPQGGRVVGLSKLPRTVAHYAHRPQVQERLTSQIADALVEHLDPLGVGVVVVGDHTCMSLRGSKTSGARMLTTDLRGVLRRDIYRAQLLKAAEVV